MKWLICGLMIMMMLLGAANAQILATGSLNVRSGPGLDYDTIGTIAEGKVMVYLYETQTDERGVDWYRIGYQQMKGWVSSKYAKDLEGPVEEVSLDEIAKYKEVAQYFDAEDLRAAASKIGLKESYLPYGDEGPFKSYDKALLLGVENVQYMTLTGPGYTIHGAAVGMKMEDACTKMLEAGMELNEESEDFLSFHRPTPENSWLDFAEHDSIIYIRCDNGIVYEIDWQGYSG